MSRLRISRTKCNAKDEEGTDKLLSVLLTFGRVSLGSLELLRYDVFTKSKEVNIWKDSR